MKFIYDKLIESGDKFIRSFDFYMSRRTTGTYAASKIQRAINGMLIIFVNYKRALMYTDYSADVTSVKKLNKRIEKLSECKNRYRLALSFKKRCMTAVTQREAAAVSSLCAIYTKTEEMCRRCINTKDTVQPFEKTQWTKRNVLLGALKNTEQLKYAIKYNFYHIPMHFIENPEDVKCVALYQSKKLFDFDAGVKYYGKVLSFEKLKRSEIKEIPGKSDKMYYKFRVESWKMLKNPIPADALGEINTFTSLYLLFNTEKTSEMHLETYDEYRIYSFMKSCAFTPFERQISIDGGEILYTGKEFEVYKNEKVIHRFSCDDFIKTGVSKTKLIKTAFGIGS